MKPTQTNQAQAEQKPFPVGWYLRAYRINSDRTRGEMYHETGYIDQSKALADSLVMAIKDFAMTEVVPVFP